MGEVKTKWSVTYTKHLKQKRKVYHDGILHLLSNNKVMLYDESDELLSSRFLTKDEVVKSGESLPFGSFLVDIGDPETKPNITSYPNPKSEYDNRTTVKTEFSDGGKLNTLHSKRKLSATRTKTSAVNISPSQKIIREFKKKELIKYEVQQTQSSPSATTPTFTEWEALYTTQITQKAKKYHDGFLRVITCGSQGRQVMLYDSGRNQLGKRFLKRDEVISSGESSTFDGYLVDVGDRMGIEDEDAKVKINGGNCKIIEKMDTFTSPKMHKSFSGNPQNIANPSKRVTSNLCNLGMEKMKPGKKVIFHEPLRDANQIMFILRKPTAMGTTGEANVKPHLSPSPGLAQLESNHPSRMVVEMDKNEEKLEFPNKVHLHVGLSLIDRLQASVDNGASVILDSSQVEGVMGSLSPVKREVGGQDYQVQPPSKLFETDLKSEAEAGLASDTCTPKCSADDQNVLLKVKIEKPNVIFDCPSFDLGFGF